MALPVWISAGLLVLLFGALTAPGIAANVLLFPNGRAVPGELGFLLGGAQVALASGGEAVWFNPAGLASETGRRLTLSGDVLRHRVLGFGGGESERLDSAFGSVSYVQALGRPQRLRRYGLGLGLASVDERWPASIELRGRVGAGGLPAGFNLGAPVDAIFPAGITRSAEGTSEGALQRLAPAVGVGVSYWDGVRLGAALHLERVSLEGRQQTRTEYQAASGGGSNTLDGQSQLAWYIRGQALHMSLSLGLQLEMGRGVALGMVLALPAQTLAASGRLHYQRSDRFTIDQGGVITTPGGSVFVARDDLEFRLESPRRIEVGLALISDQVLVELDLRFVSRQRPYDVFPSIDSQPPSTQPLTLPALRTSSADVLGMALGLAYAYGEQTSLVMGFSLEPSPVAPGDPVFRQVDLMTVSAGVYRVQGSLSGTLGLRWREARGTQVSVTPIDGAPVDQVDVSARELSIRAGGSLSF